jgi:hypothetical protein
MRQFRRYCRDLRPFRLEILLEVYLFLHSIIAFDALLHRTPKPAFVRPEQGRVERVLVTLRRVGGTGLNASLRIGADLHGDQDFAALPKDLAASQAAFLEGFRHGVTRDLAGAERRAQEARMAELGRALSAVCLPGSAGAALTGLIDGCPVGTTVEVCCEADDPELLGLPFEAMCLPDGRVLALELPS